MEQMEQLAQRRGQEQQQQQRQQQRQQQQRGGSRAGGRKGGGGPPGHRQTIFETGGRAVQTVEGRYRLVRPTGKERVGRARALPPHRPQAGGAPQRRRMPQLDSAAAKQRRSQTAP